MEDETRARSPLTPDERAEIAGMLRRRSAVSDQRAHDLADKLEADHGYDAVLQEALSEAARALGRDRGTRSESIAQRITAILGQRDETREALRELLISLDDVARPHPLAVLAAVTSAERLLAGVERTHTLVPGPALLDLGYLAEDYAYTYNAPDARQPDDHQLPNSDTALALARAAQAAARGEHVEWPS